MRSKIELNVDYDNQPIIKITLDNTGSNLMGDRLFSSMMHKAKHAEGSIPTYVPQGVFVIEGVFGGANESIGTGYGGTEPKYIEYTLKPLIETQSVKILFSKNRKTDSSATTPLLVDDVINISKFYSLMGMDMRSINRVEAFVRDSFIEDLKLEPFTESLAKNMGVSQDICQPNTEPIKESKKSK